MCPGAHYPNLVGMAWRATQDPNVLLTFAAPGSDLLHFFKAM